MNQIYAIHDKNGVWQASEEGVNKAFLDFYQDLMGNTY